MTNKIDIATLRIHYGEEDSQHALQSWLSRVLVEDVSEYLNHRERRLTWYFFTAPITSLVLFFQILYQTGVIHNKIPDHAKDEADVEGEGDEATKGHKVDQAAHRLQWAFSQEATNWHLCFVFIHHMVQHISIQEQARLHWNKFQD